jgi:hypothetical protein
VTVHQPSRSIWPIALALGVTFVSIGALTSWFVVLAGGIVTLVALAGWIEQTLEEVS